MTTLQIAEALKADILTGRIAPGTELRQVEIAHRFGVSRMPVRDALNLLAAEKLVRLRPNRGAQVIRFSAEELAEIYDLRALLEADCLRRALPRYSPADLDTIQREAKRCEAEAGAPSFGEADWRFHRALYAPAGRALQLDLIAELRRACQTHRAAYDRLREGEARWSADHRKLVAAVVMGEAALAERVLREHLRAAAEALQSAILAAEAA